ncbi:hypothetical protein [Butyricimonas paravirosa]
MKHIIYLLVCIMVTVSCTEESKYKTPNEFQYLQKKNAFRVIKISGTNNHWGEFTLTMEYDKEELSNITRTNVTNDTVGGIGMIRSTSSITYELQDWVPSIDKDSIQRLETILNEKHGAGNYRLWDSLPKSVQAIERVTVYTNTNGSIKKLSVQSFRPNEKSEAVGEDFAYSYVLSTTISSIYEYDVNSNIYINRIVYDVHDPVDKEVYERSLYKTETEYDGGKIKALAWFTAPGGAGFSEFDRYSYTYNGNQLTEIHGTNFTRTFTYSGNQVTVETNHSTMATYELDDNGNVVKMNDGEGNVYTIEYEPGHGNFSHVFVPVSEQITNQFFIK